MALTKRVAPVDSTSLEKTLTRPDSVTVVTSTGQPSTDSDWTTTAPKLLYTAPSTCKYVKIYWRKSNNVSSSSRDYASSTFPNSTTADYYYGINITDGTITREIYRGNNATYGRFSFNDFSDPDVNNTAIMQENDTFVFTTASSGSFFISGDVFTLAPGEKLQLFTGHNSFNVAYFANFEAWVYN
jgi:hypothetical protein